MQLFPVVSALLFSVSVHAQNFVGSWSGKISFSGNSQHIVFNISENAEGGSVCKMDSPDQGVKGIPASIELVSTDSISIRVPNLGTDFITAGHPCRFIRRLWSKTTNHVQFRGQPQS